MGGNQYSRTAVWKQTGWSGHRLLGCGNETKRHRNIESFEDIHAVVEEQKG